MVFSCVNQSVATSARCRSMWQLRCTLATSASFWIGNLNLTRIMQCYFLIGCSVATFFLFDWLVRGRAFWTLGDPLDSYLFLCYLKNSRATWWVLSGNFSALRNTCEQVEMRVWDLRALWVSHADHCNSPKQQTMFQLTLTRQSFPGAVFLPCCLSEA